MRDGFYAMVLVACGCNASPTTGSPATVHGDGGAGVDAGAPTGGGNQVVTLAGAGIDPGDDGSSGVKAGGGGVVIDPGNFMPTPTPLIWIANSSEGTLSKVETRTMKELARYRAGPGDAPDPSRTTVGLSGDVVVADRYGDGATKIAADPARCVDKNGNGRIDTSSGPTDVKPWGEDECVLWHVDFPKGAIARAAAFDAQVGPDGDDSSTVWIGLYGLMQVRQLDSRTGQELANLDVAPTRPYGAAIDRDGNVWVRGGELVRIDPKHHVTHIPEQCGYGIGVDAAGNVWTAGNGCVGRYAPKQDHWDTAPLGGGGWLRGLAVDGHGSVWVADTDFGVHQVDAATLKVKRDIALPFAATIGMAVDFDGRIWAISQGSSKATRIDPSSYATQSIDTGDGPYTYSDMTGYQLRNAAAPFGKWRHVFAGCSKSAQFASLGWMATLPPGTGIIVKGRAAADESSLKSAAWVLLATAPHDAPPVDLAQKLGAAATNALFEVEFTLMAVSPDVSPTLQSVSLGMSCVPEIG